MLKKYVPAPVKKHLRLNARRVKLLNKTRIFCISMQKTGTTSVGDFFEHFGYPTARWHNSHRNSWSKLWFQGNYEEIFSSLEFRSFQVFEDTPWWFPEFYKVLYHRFPKSKFILFTRDSDDWFKSMKKSFHGDTTEILQIHAKIYRREDEFYKIIDDHPDTSSIDWSRHLTLEGMANHYKSIYETRNREVIDFFKQHGPRSLFHCNLYDKNKWFKLGDFLGIDVPKNFRMHSNKTLEE